MQCFINLSINNTIILFDLLLAEKLPVLYSQNAEQLGHTKYFPKSFHLTWINLQMQMISLRVINHWNRVLKNVVNSPSLGVFISKLEVFLKDMIYFNHKLLGYMQESVG